MTLEQLITLYRADSKDEELPYFCSDELLGLYASEAQDEACRRGQLIRDSVSAICSISFAAGATNIPLSKKIVSVLRAHIDGHVAHVVSVQEMDAIFPSWEADATQTKPTHLVAGASNGVLMLWPKPEQSGAVSLTVLRLPIAQLADPDNSPEIREETHVGLVNWMLYRAYSRQDADLYDERKAATALARFESEFGSKASGRNEQWVRNGQGVLPRPIA